MIKAFILRLRNEFSGYNAACLMQDLMAGITVAAVALPLALAFAISCGADASAGLVTAIIAGLLMSLLSGTSFQISGPTGAMAAILVTVVARYSMQGMFLTCLMAGAMLVLCGVLRLGKVVSCIPLPVITGFTSGIALVIALGQIDNLFGVTSEGETLLQKLVSYRHLGFSIDMPTLLIGLAVIAIMLLWPKKWNEKVPASLIGIVLATLAVSLLELDIPTVGQIPKSILLENRLRIGDISLSAMVSLLSPAFSIAALGMIESLLCASSASRMKKESFDADVELLAQGLGNMLLPFFGGVPATAAIARTSVAIKSGGRTRLTGIFHAVVLLICVLLFSPVMEKLPLSALAGVLVVTAWRMNEWESIRTYFSKPLKGPILKFSITMLATVASDLTIAILCGIAVSFVVFIFNVSKLQVAISRVEKEKLQPEDADIAALHKGTLVVYVTGPLFFLNSDKLLRTLREVESCETMIFSMRGVPLIDISAVSALENFYETATANGCKVLFCGMQELVARKLQNCDFYEKVGDENFYWSVDRALQTKSAEMYKPALSDAI